MASETVENYLKQTYAQQQTRGEGLVPMGVLASSMGVTPGTATSMVKSLADMKLLEYRPRGGVRLTESGNQLALRVLRRHRLIELFLVDVLKLDWAEVHAEAEVLEHAISDKVLEALDAFLGRPTTDPHGDPIPPADPAAHIPVTPGPTLADAPLDTPLRIARILDQDAAFLQFVEDHALTPGRIMTVTHRDPVADAMRVSVKERGEVAFGLSAAAKVRVDPI